MIKKDDRIRHMYDDITGTATDDEANGSVTVKLDNGAVTIWAAGDAEIIEKAP